MEKARKSKGTAKRLKKAPAKKAARKLVRAAGKVASFAARKAKPVLVHAKKRIQKAAAGEKPVPARSRKSAQVIPFSELLELKNQKAHTRPTDHAESRIPPHELIDKAVLQRKPQAHTKLRSGMQGLRHK